MQLPLRTALAGLILPGLAMAQIDMAPGNTLSTGLRPSDTAFADFDLDGDQDLAVTSDNLDKVEIWSNDGQGSFTLTAQVFTGSGTSADALVAGDFNADGQMDLAVCLKNVNQVALLSNSGGVLGISQTMTVGVSPEAIDAGDLDGDGDMDLVTSNRDGNTMSVLTNAAGVFGAASTIPVGNDVRGITTGDFNGDSLADVALASHDSREVFVFTSSGAGLGTPTSIFVGGNVRPEGITAADLNGDDLMDLAVTTNGNGQMPKRQVQHFPLGSTQQEPLPYTIPPSLAIKAEPLPYTIPPSLAFKAIRLFGSARHQKSTAMESRTLLVSF